MSGASETLGALEKQHAERLLASELLDEAWPHGLTTIERAEIGRQRDEALAEIEALQERITSNRTETLPDAAVQLRRRAKKLSNSDHSSLALDTRPARAAGLGGTARRVRAARLGIGGGRARQGL